MPSSSNSDPVTLTIYNTTTTTTTVYYSIASLSRILESVSIRGLSSIVLIYSLVARQYVCVGMYIIILFTFILNTHTTYMYKHIYLGTFVKRSL